MDPNRVVRVTSCSLMRVIDCLWKPKLEAVNRRKQEEKLYWWVSARDAKYGNVIDDIDRQP